MFKKWIPLSLLPALTLVAGMAFAMSFTAVENLEFDGTTLTWDPVEGAGGYNVYYHNGGPSKFEIEFDYLTTLKDATSLDSTSMGDLQFGLYRVIAFNEDETQFGSVSSASTVWVRFDGLTGDSAFDDLAADQANNGETDATTISFYGTNNDRYLVETTCTDDSTGICTASCNTDGNTGFVTGGYCSSSDAQVNASGDADNYSCFTPNMASEITAGAYCAK